MERHKLSARKRREGRQPAKAAAEESPEAAGAPKTTTKTDYLLADG